MKTYALCASASVALLFGFLLSCQKESSVPIVEEPNPQPANFTEHLGYYEHFGFSTNAFGYPFKDTYSGTVKIDAEGLVQFTLVNSAYFLTLRAFPVSEDSAIIFKQNAHNQRIEKIDTYEGDLNVRKGILRVRFKSPSSQWWSSYTLYRAERASGSISRADYLGTYTASPEYNEPFSTYTLQMEAGNAPNEVWLKNVRGRGLTVPGRISGDTLYTERTSMDTLGNFLTATTSVLQGRVLYLSFIMQGPHYNPSSPSCSAQVKCFKTN